MGSRVVAAPWCTATLWHERLTVCDSSVRACLCGVLCLVSRCARSHALPKCIDCSGWRALVHGPGMLARCAAWHSPLRSAFKVYRTSWHASACLCRQLNISLACILGVTVLCMLGLACAVDMQRCGVQAQAWCRLLYLGALHFTRLPCSCARSDAMGRLWQSELSGFSLWLTYLVLNCCWQRSTADDDCSTCGTFTPFSGRGWRQRTCKGTVAAG